MTTIRMWAAILVALPMTASAQGLTQAALDYSQRQDKILNDAVELSTQLMSSVSDNIYADHDSPLWYNTKEARLRRVGEMLLIAWDNAGVIQDQNGNVTNEVLLNKLNSITSRYLALMADESGQLLVIDHDGELIDGADLSAISSDVVATLTGDALEMIDDLKDEILDLTTAYNSQIVALSDEERDLTSQIQSAKGDLEGIEKSLESQDRLVGGKRSIRDFHSNSLEGARADSVSVNQNNQESITEQQSKVNTGLRELLRLDQRASALEDAQDKIKEDARQEVLGYLDITEEEIENRLFSDEEVQALTDKFAEAKIAILAEVQGDDTLRAAELDPEVVEKIEFLDFLRAKLLVDDMTYGSRISGISTDLENAEELLEGAQRIAARLRASSSEQAFEDSIAGAQEQINALGEYRAQLEAVRNIYRAVNSQLKRVKGNSIIEDVKKAKDEATSAGN